MGRIRLRIPREIDHSLVDIGDEITVTHKEKNGVTMSLTGIVASRDDNGQTRRYVTSEGGTLFAYSPGNKHGITITLHSREEKPTETLFDIGEIRERIAS